MTSRIQSSSKREKRSAQGFTLVELLISIAIMGIITALVLTNYKSFDSTVLLKGAAYEIALSLRDIQTKSVSVVRGSANFEYPYGMTFTPGLQTYKAFRFASSTAVDTYYDIDDPDPDLASDIGTTSITRSMEIYQVCISTVNNSTYDCSMNRLDVSFRRPEFKSIFHAFKTPSTEYPLVGDPVTGALIKVRSRNGGDIFVVEVTQFGQISVYKE